MSQFSFFFVSLMAVLLSLGPCLAAKSHADPTVPSGELTVRVYDYVRMPAGDYELARGHAERILARAGVPTRWLNCPLKRTDPGDPACWEPITPTDVILRIVPAQMASKLPNSDRLFGYALPASGTGFGTVVTAFHHRVEELVRSMRTLMGSTALSRPTVLGHILAHEVGHILLGPNSHSRAGIMSFPWSRLQLEKGLRGGLLFLAPEARKMQREIRRRWEARLTRKLP